VDWLIATASTLFDALGRGIFAKLFLWGILLFPVAALVGYFGLLRGRSKDTSDKDA
jgi:hypothetical protein